MLDLDQKKTAIEPAATTIPDEKKNETPFDQSGTTTEQKPKKSASAKQAEIMKVALAPNPEGVRPEQAIAISATDQKSGLCPEKQAMAADIIARYITATAGMKFEDKIFRRLSECEKHGLNSIKMLKLINQALAAPIRHRGN